MDTYVLGANEKLRLDVSVVNAGEDAFESVLQLQLPPDVNLVQIDQTKSVGFVRIRFEYTFFIVFASDRFRPISTPFDSIQLTKVTWQEYRIENTGQSKIDFDLGNPLPAGKSVRMIVELTAKESLTASKSNYDFRFNLTCSNPEANQTLTDNSLFLQVPLRVDVKLEPYGYV
jgi:hypothetical protein